VGGTGAAAVQAALDPGDPLAQPADGDLDSPCRCFQDVEGLAEGVHGGGQAAQVVALAFAPCCP
jgi:hypothetical protein